MKAITQHCYGGPDMLALADVPAPAPGADEVLIRVQAASVNAADWLLMRGDPYLVRLAFGLRGPRVSVRGRDAAGVVETVGSNVTAFTPGDEVYAETNAGSFAEFTVVDQKRVARRPLSVSVEQASIVPIAGTTALQAVRFVDAGQRVLITGASGGVGSFAVQLAVARGASVTALTRTPEIAIQRAAASTEVQGSYDVILDVAGVLSLRELCGLLTPTGTLVLVSGKGGRVLGPIGRILAGSLRGLVGKQRIRALASSANGADLDELRELIEAGAVVLDVAATYPLAETAAALRLFGTGEAGGKIVVTI
jgi:NADPH:quinone reductase-like Zn-dependent oxidoreductase